MNGNGLPLSAFGVSAFQRDGSTLLQVIERGETDHIWPMAYELEPSEPALSPRGAFSFQPFRISVSCFQRFSVCRVGPADPWWATES